MSTTVKVFIVLNLLLALAFMWISMTLYATSENWKRRWDADTAFQAKELKATDAKLAEESYKRLLADALVKNLDFEKKAETQRANEKQAEVTSLNERITDMDKRLTTLQADNAAQRENIATLTNTLEQTRQRNTELAHIAQVARAVAFQLNIKLAETEDDFNNTSTELQQRNEELAKVGKTLKDSEARLAQVRDNFPDVWKTISDPTGGGAFVQGVVAAVRVNPQGQQDLVMLSIGKEEGISEGMEFIVYRANQYIVKVRAERVINDMVACRVIANSWNTGGAKIQQGDLAQNRF